MTDTNRKEFWPPRIFDKVDDFKKCVPKILKKRKLEKRRIAKEEIEAWIYEENYIAQEATA